MRRQINFIKGFDRIALILAIVSILPSFLLGVEFVDNEFKTISNEYVAWKNLELEKREQLLNEYRALSAEDKLSRINEQYEKAPNQISQDSRRTKLMMLARIQPKKMAEIGKITQYPEVYERYYINLHQVNWYQPPAPEKYVYPEKTKTISGGLIFAILSFLIVLFGLRGITRGIKMLSLYVIDGFRNE
jgi:hypothetical protein